MYDPIGDAPKLTPAPAVFLDELDPGSLKARGDANWVRSAKKSCPVSLRMILAAARRRRVRARWSYRYVASKSCNCARYQQRYKTLISRERILPPDAVEIPLGGGPLLGVWSFESSPRLAVDSRQSRLIWIAAADLGVDVGGRDRPWRNALRLEIDFPATLRGPVDRWAFRRFAAICFALATGNSFEFAQSLGARGGVSSEVACRSSFESMRRRVWLLPIMATDQASMIRGDIP